MKTLVKNNISLMVIPDEMPLKTGEYILIGDPVRIKVDNLDGLIIVYENVTPPANYEPKRYYFNGTEWTYNDNWRNSKLTATSRR